LADDGRAAVVRQAWALIGGAALVWGAWRAAQLAWVCDDAFVSFRYAEHLIRGEGLVFNLGERVEGYTNPLWTVVIAACMAVGLDPVGASEALGWAAFVAIGGALLVSAVRDGRAPVAAVAWALTPDVQVWATGGLETSWFAGFALLGLGLAEARPAWAGLALGAAVATRPDGALFLVPALLSTPDPRRLLAVFAACVAPQLLFKLGYYGHLAPTAFWSKSAMNPWYEQGLRYLAVFFAENPAWIGLAGLAGVGAARDRSAGRWLGAAGLFLLYVAHSGGDYMHARRVIPALPLLLMAASAAPAGTWAWLGLALALASARPMGWLGEVGSRWWGVGDERAYYPPEAIAARRAQGEAFAAAFRGVDAKVVIEGGMVAFAYYSRWPYVVEATGLAHYDIAGQPIAARGHPGHEKGVTEAWLDEHGVSLIVRQDPPGVRPNGRPDELLVGDQVRLQVRYADPALDGLVGRPGILYPGPVAVIDSAAGEVRKNSGLRTGVDAFLDRFVFSRRADGQALRQRYEAAIAGQGSSPASPNTTGAPPPR
jgi:hypothetical protein